MKINHIALGFSLVEVLVALFIVSLTAVNISGLQKIVADQSRDNFSHATVLHFAKERIEEVKQIDDIQKFIDLNGITLTQTDKGTLFTFTWSIELDPGVGSSSPVRNVAIQVTWPDATGSNQIFTYSEQISLDLLFTGIGGNAQHFSYTIPNLLKTNQVNYFESKIGYEKESYVIYDSQLFQATSSHYLDNGLQGDIVTPIDEDGAVTSGWDSLGRIDRADLADLFSD